MVSNWAELKFGPRLKKLADKARHRVGARHPEHGTRYLKEKYRHHIWLTLTEHTYTRQAFWTWIFLGLCIVCSTIFFVLETVPEMERNDKWVQTFFYGELFFVTVFTIEISLRIWSTPHTLKEYMSEPLNVIDILAILPFYVELLMVLIMGSETAMMDLRLLRAFRLMRMLKMGRFSTELQLLAEGLVRARVSFALLAINLVIGMVVFAVILWILERGTWDPEKQCFSREDEPFFSGCSPFESVPRGFWWGITTMTTVGYGDAFPITFWGRVTGGIAMLAGIFCVALPTGILCTEFSKLYDERSHTSRAPELGAAHQHRPKDELQLIVNSHELHRLQTDIGDCMTKLNRLAQIHAEDHGHELRLNPFYTTLQEENWAALKALGMFVQGIVDEIEKTRPDIIPFRRRSGSWSSGPTPQSTPAMTPRVASSVEPSPRGPRR